MPILVKALGENPLFKMKTTIENLFEGEKEYIELSPKEYFYREEAPADHIFCLKEGLALTFKKNSKGRNLWLGFVKPGEVLGLNALKNDSYGHSMQALVNTSAIKVSVEKIRDLLKKDVHFRLKVMQEWAKQINSTESKTLMIHNKTLKQKIAYLILELIKPYQNKQELHIPLYHPFSELANFLGTTAQKVDKTLNELYNQGLIQQSPQNFKVLKPELIEALI